MSSGSAQMLATKPVLTSGPCLNSLPRYAQSAVLVGQLPRAPPSLPPPGLLPLGSTREQHPLRSSSHAHLHGQSTVEGTEADAEGFSSCSTTDTVLQDVPAFTGVLRQMGSELDTTAAVCEPCRVLSLHSAVPEFAPLGHKSGHRWVPLATIWASANHVRMPSAKTAATMGHCATSATFVARRRSRGARRRRWHSSEP